MFSISLVWHTLIVVAVAVQSSALLLFQWMNKYQNVSRCSAALAPACDYLLENASFSSFQPTNLFLQPTATHSLLARIKQVIGEMALISSTEVTNAASVCGIWQKIIFVENNIIIKQFYILVSVYKILVTAMVTTLEALKREHDSLGSL